MKKRSMLLVSIAVLLVVMMITPLASAAVYAYVYTSNGKGLNFRSDYVKEKGNIIGSIPYGAKVEVLGYEESDYWAEVSYKGRVGYVMTRYLQKNEPAKKSDNKTDNNSSSKTATGLDFSSFADAKYNASIRPSAPGGFVNLRWAPSKSEAIRERMADGQAVEVIAQNKTWAQVRLTGTDHVGFVMRSFLSETSNGDS